MIRSPGTIPRTNPAGAVLCPMRKEKNQEHAAESLTQEGAAVAGIPGWGPGAEGGKGSSAAPCTPIHWSLDTARLLQ